MAELRWTWDELFFLASINFCSSCRKDCNECGLYDFIGFLKEADGRADNG